MAWAEENWPLFDGRCALAGIEAFDLSVRSMANLSYSMILDSPGLVFDNEAREKIVKLFSWPDDDSPVTSDAQARQAASALGLQNPDVLVQRMVEAQRAAGVEV